MKATGVPTGISIPSAAAMLRITPSPGDSTSIAALSVSISKIGAPLATVSPSLTYHLLILPVAMSMSTRGRMTSSGMILDPAGHEVAHGAHDAIGLRHCRLLKHRVVRNRRLGAAQAQDRRVEIVESVAFGNHGADLGADAQCLDALID